MLQHIQVSKREIEEFIVENPGATKFSEFLVGSGLLIADH